MIRCRTLGPVHIDVDGGPPPPELLWRRNIALLIYLACSPRRTRTREHLVGLLWPEKDERAARHSLNEALRVLRRAVGSAAINTSAGQVRLTAGDPWLDLDELDARMTTRDWAGASALVGGDFLEGFALPDASGFEDWLSGERSRWRGRSVNALLSRADELERGGRAREAAETAERALALDLTSDRAVRAVMRARALSGDRSAGLGCYAAFAERLGSVAGCVPEAETERVAEQIRRERGGPAPRSTGGDATTLRRAPLVGRAAEMARLVDLADAAVAGSRALLAVVEGEAGSGKSRLVDEVGLRARLDGALVAGVRAVPADRAEANGGLLALARGGLLDARGIAAAPPAALAAFTRAIAEWADRFPAVRAVAPTAPAAAFTDILRACAEEQPVVLWVDDAHHLDEDSVLALGRALRDLASAPLLMLLAVAPHSGSTPLEDLRARIGRDVQGTVVHLGPLSGDALVSLVQWALPLYDAPAVERLARRLASDSAGLPLLAVELVYAVAQGLDLGTVAGAWPQPFRTLSETLPGDLPDAVRAAVRVGFRRLSADAQRVLAAAAVLGDRVSPAPLARATELAFPAVNAALDELEWTRWLHADPRGYAFVARVVREVVAVDMTTPGQRQRIRERGGSP